MKLKVLSIILIIISFLLIVINVYLYYQNNNTINGENELLYQIAIKENDFNKISKELEEKNSDLEQLDKDKQYQSKKEEYEIWKKLNQKVLSQLS